MQLRLFTWFGNDPHPLKLSFAPQRAVHNRRGHLEDFLLPFLIQTHHEVERVPWFLLFIAWFEPFLFGEDLFPSETAVRELFIFVATKGESEGAPLAVVSEGGKRR